HWLYFSNTLTALRQIGRGFLPVNVEGEKTASAPPNTLPPPLKPPPGGSRSGRSVREGSTALLAPSSSWSSSSGRSDLVCLRSTNRGSACIKPAIGYLKFGGRFSRLGMVWA